MINCCYCKKELDPDFHITSEKGPACSDCALKPEESEPIEDQAQDKQPKPNQESPQDQTPFNLIRAYRELQFIRLNQMNHGETDGVIMKRPLSEILLMVEKEIEKAKSEIITLESEGPLKARFHLLSAITYGLAYLSTHPGPN